MTDKGQDEIEPEDRPRIGDYILVKVPGKVTSPWQKLMETHLSYLARVSSNTFKSSENEDEAWVDTKYTLKKLPKPTIGSWELMKFEVDIECEG